MNKWQQVTKADEPVHSDGIEFTFTPQDRDMVQMARLDVLARARSFGRDTSGLKVAEVAYTELSETERAAFGMGGE